MNFLQAVKKKLKKEKADNSGFSLFSASPYRVAYLVTLENGTARFAIAENKYKLKYFSIPRSFQRKRFNDISPGEYALELSNDEYINHTKIAMFKKENPEVKKIEELMFYYIFMGANTKENTPGYTIRYRIDEESLGEKKQEFISPDCAYGTSCDNISTDAFVFDEHTAKKVVEEMSKSYCVIELLIEP